MSTATPHRAGRAEITVVAADPLTDPRWHELATTPEASLFTAPPWLAAVCGPYGLTAESRLPVHPGGRPVGGFAWVAVDDPRGRRLLSLPFCDRADPPVPDTATWQLLLDSAGIGSGDTPFTLRCLDRSPAAGGPVPVAGEAAWPLTPP